MTNPIGALVGCLCAPQSGWMTSFCGGGHLYGNPDGSYTRVAEDGTETIIQKEPE